jgi:hypothetical protein
MLQASAGIGQIISAVVYYSAPLASVELLLDNY